MAGTLSGRDERVADPCTPFVNRGEKRRRRERPLHDLEPQEAVRGIDFEPGCAELCRQGLVLDVDEAVTAMRITGPGDPGLNGSRDGSGVVAPVGMGLANVFGDADP